MYKPIASRNTSAEIYAIGMRYKAPAKIDRRLLDIKHLFQGSIEPPKVSGCTVSIYFIWSAKPFLIVLRLLTRWWMFSKGQNRRETVEGNLFTLTISILKTKQDVIHISVLSPIFLPIFCHYVGHRG